MQRVITGTIGAASAVAAVLYLDPLGVFVVCLLLFEGAAFEYVRLGRLRYPAAPLGTLMVILPLVVLGAWLGSGDPGAAPTFLALGLAPLLFAMILVVWSARGEPPSGRLKEAAGALGFLSFGVVYLAMPVWGIVELHRFDRRLLLLFLVTVWLNDSAAYYVGSSFGRHRLAPALSPGKTWEGSLGGLLAAAVFSLPVLWWMEIGPLLPMWLALLVSIVVAQLGDLVESLLKRVSGVKDSGSILPGHGGLLDRIDAIILSAPVFCVLSTRVDGLFSG